MLIRGELVTMFPVDCFARGKISHELLFHISLRIWTEAGWIEVLFG